MKTIRTNCFETNSSSTHSITIESKTSVMNEDGLVINGELIPDKLCFTSAYHETKYGDGHTLHAITRDQKAALLICHIISIYEDDESATKSKMLEAAVEQLIASCGYSSVKTVDVKYRPFYGYVENGSSYLSDIASSGNIEEGIANHVHDVILNDDVIVIDTENPE